MQLAEQIAVLDGIDTSSLAVDDGRIGQVRAQPGMYSKPVMPGVTMRRNVLDASEGANYSGGSSYAAGLPLMPSSIGLAGLRGFRGVPGVLPEKMHVIDPSGGANYTGGSSYAPRMPLVVSSSGLAQADGYGRAGLGQAIVAGGYGAAGLGNAPSNSYVDNDLASAFNGFEATRPMDPNDGRIGQQAAQPGMYSKPVMPGVTMRRNVLDASEGANYSGGSSYAAGLPLMPSSVGLAGLDRVPDSAFVRKLGARAGRAFTSKAGKSAVNRLSAKYRSSRSKAMRATTPQSQAVAAQQALIAAAQLQRVRAARQVVLASDTINGVRVSASRPYSPSTLWK